AGWSRRGRGRVRSGDEGAQQLELLPVAAVGPRELQDCRDFAETFVVHQESERLLAQLPLPDVLVAVRPRTQVAFRVVQVKGADLRQADRLVHASEQNVIALRGPEVVARRERVARVDADG